MAIRKNKWVCNVILLLAGIATSLSGIFIQGGYHLGNSDPTTKIIFGLDYETWSFVHKISIVIFMLFCMYHLSVHRKWYKVVLAKQLLRKKNRQVLYLSFFFLLSAVTGLIPWSIDCLEGSINLRRLFIEIHDKVSLLLVLFILLHAIKRRERFF